MALRLSLSLSLSPSLSPYFIPYSGRIRDVKALCARDPPFQFGQQISRGRFGLFAAGEMLSATVSEFEIGLETYRIYSDLRWALVVG